jgi:magnesium transporter
MAPNRANRRVRVVLSSTALLSLMSGRNAAAVALSQLGIAAFFVPGTVPAAFGNSAGWCVLAAAVLSALVRAVDIESWALFIPGGFLARLQQAFGPRVVRLGAAAGLVERLFLAALAAVLIGHYTAGITVTAIAGLRLTGHVRAEDLATFVAVVLIGAVWVRARTGLDIGVGMMARGVWIGAGVLVVTTIWSVLSLIRSVVPLSSLLSPPSVVVSVGLPAVDVGLTWLFGIALALPVLGGGEALTYAAHELPRPRVQALRRTAAVTLAFTFCVTVLSTFLLVLLIPAGDRSLWTSAPLAGLVQYLAAPSWLRGVIALGLIAAAVLMLAPAAHAALGHAEQVLQRLSLAGTLPRPLGTLHARFGTPAQAIDVATAAAILVILVSSGQVTWLARGYAMAVAVTVVLKVGVLIRLRRLRAEATPFRVPLNVSIAGHELSLGLLAPGLACAGSAMVMLATGDVPSIATTALLATLFLLLTLLGRDSESPAVAEDQETFDVLPAAELSLAHVEVRPGNVLVPVRNPHSLAHVAAALQAARDRDVVVLTIRLVGVDVPDDASTGTAPTPPEERLLSDVLSVAERLGRPVRLLIVPASNVFDAIVATTVQLRSSEVHVGESSTLSAEEQARLLGDAWERAVKPEPLDVRLVILHRSGRSDTYHLGAHAPSLAPGDLDLIHRVWLLAVKAIGPHVHHHDVVRAALTQMEQQLNGPDPDAALATIRALVRPAEELAAVLRARDYARLRDMLRNRHAGEVAALLTELSIEDQVVVFRVLPRKDAAAVFEYLTQEAQEALLKAMAQEDVAALLNNMAPDDRTRFLEELPAAVTRQLLALLTPAERAVALTLLGYPEKSVGRRMTPHYVAIREHWTVLDVLDYVRAHGQDSETLNVIYVVDEHGLLIDDIRIREFLLAPIDRRVSDLMDRRFVALKATDDQDAAVAVFRQYDRSALPVTDTAGMLIGIVTIDDVLDVAEARATREIHRIGGSEALDEPYMQIGFGQMIQKRAGWLTALFLGEMLTATAMGSFEQEISRAVVLALFVPLIISSGGNSGSQASTLVIRALALGEVGLHDWWRVMRREIMAGLALGGILGAIGFLRITLWSAFSNIYGPHWPLIAVTVALSLVGVVLWGTLTGSLLPFLLRRLGFDPAASSAPFVATLVDVTGLVIYFTVALVVLRGTLL